MKVFLVFIFLLIGTIFNKLDYRLTNRENEVRLGSCGDPLGETLWLALLCNQEMYEKKKNEAELAKPRKTTKTPQISSTIEYTIELNTTTSDVTSDTNDTTDESNETTTAMNNAKETTETVNLVVTTEKPKTRGLSTNAVFISQSHLLTSSSWWIQWKYSNWVWKTTNIPVDNSTCLHNKHASLRLNITDLHLLDSRLQWRNSKEIVFLRFCEFQNSQEGFLTLIVATRSKMTVPLICLPKTTGKKKQNRLEIFDLKEDNMMGKITKCEVNNHAHFYTSASTCMQSQGAPLVKKDNYVVDRLIGIGALEYGSQTENFKFHIIQEYMEEMCKAMGICKREIEQIGHIPDGNDGKVRKIIDDDYAEQVAEPDILDMSDQSEKLRFFIILGITFVLWLL